MGNSRITQSSALCSVRTSGRFWFAYHVTSSHFLWPLPRWRVGHEFRWCVCSVLWLILHFLLDVHFHIEHADAPEEEEQEDGKFRVLLVSLKPGPECCETASSLLVQDLRCHRPYWSEYQFVLSQKVTKWTKRNRPCRVTQPQKSC